MVAVEAVNIVSLPGDAEINEQLVFSDAICRDGFCLVSGDAGSRVSTGNQTPVRGCGELQSLAGSEPFRRMACGPTEPLPLRISQPVRPRDARSRISTGLSNPASGGVMFPPVPSHPCPASCNPRPTDRRRRNVPQRLLLLPFRRAPAGSGNPPPAGSAAWIYVWRRGRPPAK